MPALEMYGGDSHDDVAAAERRKHDRVKVAVPVEFKPEGADCFTHAETSDLSCGGCYVEMGLTLPVGTPLELHLWLNDTKLLTTAVVVTADPSFGNGIQFIDLTPEEYDLLHRFLQTAGDTTSRAF
jgi:hypothetical protein